MNEPVDLTIDGRAPVAGPQPSTSPRRFWRSFEELENDPSLEAWVKDEFPAVAPEWKDGPSRRRFLQIMGASIAFAGLQACTRQPEEKIVPYVKDPEHRIPGKPLFFASAYLHGGYAQGVLVESHDGRPTKIEGNPDHPASLGSTSTLAQASVLQLYDPDRSRAVRHRGEIRKWEAFTDALRAALQIQQSKKGAGFRLLTGTITSPTLGSQIDKLRSRFPQLIWHQYDPVNRDNSRRGSQLAFGRFLDTRLRLDRAATIVSIEHDFFYLDPGCVRYARDYADGRRIRRDTESMNRLYAIESRPTITGAAADHRLAVRADRIWMLVTALASRIGAIGKQSTDPELDAGELKWISAVADELSTARSASIVSVGESQPPQVHALVHAINHYLGNVGETIEYIAPVEPEPVIHSESVSSLVSAMRAGEVDLLMILGGNPAFDAPADLSFADQLDHVRLSVHLSLNVNETSRRCDWHVPQSHDLEAWSDARAYDGTASIIQPLIEPLYFSKSSHEMLAAVLDEGGKAGDEIVRDHWQTWLNGPNATASDGSFDRHWRRWLHDGLIADTRPDPIDPELRAVDSWFDTNAQSAGSSSSTRSIDKASNVSRFTLQFAPDYSVWDGRLANLAWLQELPRPLTKLTWDNALLLNAADARGLDVSNGEIVSVQTEHGSIDAPIWVTPGHARGAVTIHLGYGRQSAGRVGNNVGVDVYPVRTANAPWFVQNVKLTRTGRFHRLATTQTHQSMEGRDLIRVATLEEFLRHPEGAGAPAEHLATEDESRSLYPPPKQDPNYAWGMTIDLTACIGCNACTIACQSENNIPVVGKEQVLNGREMHWIRVDRYFEGEAENASSHHQPVPCMQCENAPCEIVCPVEATVHNVEGLNQMIYNRCVGTRYCSNNCPYKVRRFNFLWFNDTKSPTLAMQRNPNVTVRSQGVMEKCTYCIQRISAARIDADKENRLIRDGEVETACQAVCPTQAITFGNLRDKNSRVSKLKEQPHDYGILTELRTRPRTTYLARVQNPNPQLTISGQTNEETPHDG